MFVYPEVTKSFISDTEEISDQILVFPRVNLEPFGWPKVTTFEILGIDALLHFAVESTFLILQLPENQKVAECRTVSCVTQCIGGRAGRGRDGPVRPQ